MTTHEDPEAVNESRASEQAVAARPIKAQSVAVPRGTASICNAEWACRGGMSGRSGFVQGFPALQPATCLDGLARIELGRSAWYCGHIAEVRRLSMHRLLLLREVARDGSALAVWVSSVAIVAERSTHWATLLDAQPLPALAVRFRSRFPSCSALDPLTADIHFPEDIGVCRGNQPSVFKTSVAARSRCR